MLAKEVNVVDFTIVGPLLPYRGGISRYNTELFRSCEAIGLEVRAYSFSRQYPKWLYPGKDDRSAEHLDFREPGATYCIDSVNPLTWGRAAKKIIAEAPRMVVFHWWSVFWAPSFYVMIAVLRRSGIRVTLICHNLSDHDGNGLKRWLSRRIISLADGYVAHSDEHAKALARDQPGKSVFFHPLPPFSGYPEAEGRLSKRGRLELLFFGFIRPYKGLDVLLQALASLDDHEVFLTVVGEPWGEVDRLVAAAAQAPNVELHLSYCNEKDLAEYFHRADAVVLPYRNATGSAVAALAIHYAKPMLATRVGGLVDVVIPGHTGLLVPPGDPVALSDAIRAFDRERASELAEGVEAFKQRWSWVSLANGLSTMAGHAVPCENVG